MRKEPNNMTATEATEWGDQIRVFADMLSDTLNGTFRNNEVSERMLDNLAIFCSNYLYGIAQEVEGLFNLARSGQSLHLNLKKEIK